MKTAQKAEEAYFSAEEDLPREDPPFVYEDLELLASGGFGDVFSGRHKVLQVPLVVKITSIQEDDDEEQNEFLWRAFDIELDFYEKTAGRSDISWMPAFYGSGKLDYCGIECPWIALEQLHGCMWGLNAKGESASQFRHLILGAFDALKGLHTEGYVHRDVKLENFAVRKNAPSGELEVCLIDFGLLMSYNIIEREGEDDKLIYEGTMDYSSDRHLQERMVGPADDLESLGYSILELFIGETWRAWGMRMKVHEKIQLKKFVEENKGLVLPTTHRKKRGRNAQQAQQEAQLPLISANNRPRHRPRGLKANKEQKKKQEKEEEEPILEARIVLAPAAALAAGASAAAAVAAPQSNANLPAITENITQQRIEARSDACLRVIKRRNEVWDRLEKQGKIPNFFKEYMAYCKSLTAYDVPDYDKLRAILQSAPKVAHIAQALRGKGPLSLQQED